MQNKNASSCLELSIEAGLDLSWFLASHLTPETRAALSTRPVNEVVDGPWPHEADHRRTHGKIKENTSNRTLLALARRAVFEWDTRPCFAFSSKGSLKEEACDASL